MGIFRRKGSQLEIGNWYTGWKSWKFEITFRDHGYDEDDNDDRAELHISMFGWHSVFKLPFKCKNIVRWREEKKYGISIHMRTVFFHWGFDLKGWGIPFITYDRCCRWERYTGPEEFVDIPSNWDTAPYMVNYREGCKDPSTWSFVYTDPYDGAQVPCKFWVEELEWRPKWLGWTKLFRKVRRSIEVEFSEEMGPRKGSWKGGTIGCGFNMLPGEHPTETILRMQRDYDFS